MNNELQSVEESAPVRTAQMTASGEAAGQSSALRTADTSEAFERTVSDLSTRLDQTRDQSEGAIRDLTTKLEQLRDDTEQRNKEIVTKLAQLDERAGQLERRLAASSVVAPTAQSAGQEGPPALAKPMAAPVHPPAATPERVAPKPSSNETTRATNTVMGETNGAESTRPASAGAQTGSTPATIPAQMQTQESPASVAMVPRREDALSAAVPRRGRARRFARVTAGLAAVLGLGWVGGMNTHRLIDANETSAWLQKAIDSVDALGSGFEFVRAEIASRAKSFGHKSITVAADPPQDSAAVAQPAAQSVPTAPSAAQVSTVAVLPPSPTTVAQPSLAEQAEAPALSMTPGSNLININTASVEELNRIGGRFGQAIIRGRPYASIDELVSKRILTRAVFSQIKDQITAR